jgi:Prp8 binding protein
MDLCGREPIILTGSKDNNMLLGELDAQDYA